VNNYRIRMLNRKFLGKDMPTDVIAFDLAQGAGEPFTADIAVSTDMACANAVVFKTQPLRELYLYVIHGVLHLLGWRDDTLRKQKLMQKKADTILGEICPAKKQKR
jgi:probable rRNA maturation factor